MNMGKHSKNYPKNKFLTIDDFKFVVYEYTKSHYSSNEPLGSLAQNTINKIKGILDIHKHRYYTVLLDSAKPILLLFFIIFSFL